MGRLSPVLTAGPEEVEHKARELFAVAECRGNCLLATMDYLREKTPHESVHATAAMRQTDEM
jgi:hypothetical protein